MQDDKKGEASSTGVHEFVSDSVRASDTDIEEVRAGMEKLGMKPKKGQCHSSIPSIEAI